MLRTLLDTVLMGRTLDREQARHVLTVAMSGGAPPEQVAGLLVALRSRGEAPGELAGMADAMRAAMLPVGAETEGPIVDISGTGGDGAGTFNLSTTAAIVAAAAGARVAKLGQRAISSRCGSAEVAEALGIPWNLAPDASARCLTELGITFVFGPNHHPALRPVTTIRKALGVRTALNLLGPLAHPARVRRQVIGVASREVAERLAGAILELGAEHTWVLCGDDGQGGTVDEFSPCGPTAVWEVRGATVTQRTWAPEALGLTRCGLRALRGGDPDENAAAVEAVLAGEPGPRGDAVALNAGAALVVSGLVPDLRAGLTRARDVLATGAGRDLLARWRSFPREAA